MVATSHIQKSVSERTCPMSFVKKLSFCVIGFVKINLTKKHESGYNPIEITFLF
jgi:hypothetical protein